MDPQWIQAARKAESAQGPAAAVPLAEAKNRLSALVDRVEQGEDVSQGW
ncbi:MAG: type II toxin-antitoxin system prevent-host-death family antitoxin [Synechococcaceae cyanobacterium]|nr:type II toxin-antitoxin system prevent-host-death family antitoxin [Synechococcaceae cyanobacterium]